MSMTEGNRIPSDAFAQLLRRYRLAAGLTQAELAERAGLSVYSISNLERGVGHVPRPATVRLLAEALGLDDMTNTTFKQAVWMLHGADHHIPEMTRLPTAAGQRMRLPEPLTPLIGRDEDLHSAATILEDASNRLLTFVGAPGVGKTRLALAAVAHCRESLPDRDGAFFVSLAAVTDANQIPVRIARALSGSSIESAEPSIESLSAVLQTRHVLLVLDNCEHLPDIAPLLADLLAACSGVRALATSRAPLHMRGERLFSVPPLAVPSAETVNTLTFETLARTPAIALFVTHARSAHPDFMLTYSNIADVAEICRRLDGLPLALELAAPRLRALSPKELLRRLESRLSYLTGGSLDLPARQRDLRITLDWSYSLLTESAQPVFRWLAAFRGGAAMEALEAIAATCDAAPAVQPSPRLLNALEELFAHNLAWLEVDVSDTSATEATDNQGRVALLETVREYAEERLRTAENAEERTVRDAHAAWCLGLAETAADALRGPDQVAWQARLEVERANLIVAFAWLAQQGASGDRHAAEAALRLAVATYWFWSTRAPLATGRAWLESSLAMTAVQTDIAAQAAAMSSGTRDEEKPTELLALRAAALHALGSLTLDQGDLTVARDSLREALRLRQLCGDLRGTSASLNVLGLVDLQANDPIAARADFAASLKLRRQIGDLRGIASTLNNMGLARKAAGQYRRAVATLEIAARRARVAGDSQLQAAALANRADTLRLLGRLAEAVSDAVQSLEIRRGLGERHGMGQSTGILGSLAEAQGDLTTAHNRYREALGYFISVGSQLGILEALTAIALLSLRRGEHAKAARLLGVVEAERSRLNLPLWDVTDQEQLIRALGEARLALGDAEYAEVHATGMRTPLQVALREELGALNE